MGGWLAENITISTQDKVVVEVGVECGNMTNMRGHKLLCLPHGEKNISVNLRLNFLKF